MRLLCTFGLHRYSAPIRWTSAHDGRGTTFIRRVCDRAGCRHSKLKRLS